MFPISVPYINSLKYMHHDKCCWACWSDEEAFNNKLIRACLKCKDPALQYIHQQCIDTFIKNQLLAKHPDEIVVEPFPAFVSTRTLMQIANKQIEMTQTKSPGFSMIYTGEFDGINFVEFYCARCLDRYRVEAKRVSPIRVLTSDKFILGCLLAMMICILYLTLLCVHVVMIASDFAKNAQSEAELTQLLVKSFVYKDPVDIRTWAKCLLGTVYALCGVMFVVIWGCCSDYRLIRVSEK